jgi:tetratricopeptide (TPR) repeat protein
VESRAETAAAPSLDRIVETFRQKIGENLTETDFDTHFNLGIAYREMGLLDESITEFQLAAKDSRYLVDCCSLLGTSFLEKGFPDLAVKWYRRGLEASTTEPTESLGLLYELGSLYQSIGDVSGARESYGRIREMEPDYRDVTKRLKALASFDEG